MGGDGFLTLANQMLEEAMLGEDFSQSFLNDVVAPVKYGQSVRISVFLEVVSLAGADPCLWAVDGGNKVCSGLLYHSKEALIPARVTAFSVKLQTFKAGKACRLHLSTFAGFFPPIPSQYPGHLHQTVTTLVPGLLNVPYLGTSEKPSTFSVSDILTTDSIINSLSSIDPVHIPPGYSCPPVNESKVWKVFSPPPLSQEQLQDMFLSSETKYPAHSPPHGGTSPFILHERLYYLNTVEWEASTMEMSTISARNLALLAHHHGQVRPGGPAHV